MSDDDRTVLYENSQWRVSDHGIETLDGKYHFAKTRLNERRPGSPEMYDWPPHLAEKEWVDLSAFLDAFRRAFTLHRIPFDEGAYRVAVEEAQNIRVGQ